MSWHTHDTNSHGDGFGTTEQHMARVSELGMTHVGFSNHGNVDGHPAAEQLGIKYGIGVIHGIEAYFAPPDTRAKFHITVFAATDQGYHNLNKIVTQSFIDSYQYPTVTWENLRKNNAGIVVFSGCSDSLISCTLLGGKSLGDKRLSFTPKQYLRARRRIERFRDVFPGRFYLEVQRFPGLARTRTLNPAFADLSRSTGVPLIASADVHYPFAHQGQMQKTLHAARRSSSVALIGQEWEYDLPLTYPESDEEIISDLVGTGLEQSVAADAVEQTATLAHSINVVLPKAKPLRFKTTNRRSASEQLRDECAKGLLWRSKSRPDIGIRSDEYERRISNELRTILDKDFSDYFLVTADLIKKAKDADETIGPGRGSAAGSLVCYVLGITEIDPLHPAFSRMVFERFIDPTRSDMPDIDIDFDDELRLNTPARAREIYGAENVCSVANHSKYRGKKALNSVAVAHGLSPQIFAPIGKRCSIRVETDDRVDDSIQDVVDSYRTDPVISGIVEQYGDQISQAIQLEGNKHSVGVHAGGFVIASEPIPEVCAIYTKEKGTGRKAELTQVIPYDKRDAEYLNMLKMDFLGLTTMGMIGKARAWAKIDLPTLYNLFYKEYEKHVRAMERKAFRGNVHDIILQAFRDDDCAGIFQYEGGTTRQVVREVQPRNMDELAACNALSRPGPLYGGQTKAYISVKNGEYDWRRIHPDFDRHVEWTYGQIVYQEQIMWILRDLAGFPIDRVLRVRKIIGKKLGEFAFAELWAEFRDGCASNGLGEEDARLVWGGITTAAGYAFNTAHAYSYALIAWWSMWLKIHYVPEFFAASLAKNGDGKDDIARRTALLQDAVKHHIGVADIDPNDSHANWRPFYEHSGFGNVHTIIPGFQQIPGVGEATAEDIATWRDTQPGSVTWAQMGLPVKNGGVSGIGEKTVRKIEEFVSQRDALGITKTQDQLDAFRTQMMMGDFNGTGIPAASSFFATDSQPEIPGHYAFVGLVSNVVERDEVELVRNKTGKPTDEILADLQANGELNTKKATLFAYDEHGEMALRCSRWKYAGLSPKIQAIKTDHHIVVGYGRVFEGRSNSLQLEQLWILDPD